MTTELAKPPHLNKSSQHTHSKSNIEALRTGVEVDLFESLYINYLWSEKMGWVLEGRSYNCRYPEIPATRSKWPDGRGKTYLESLAEEDLDNMQRSFTVDYETLSPEERNDIHEVNRPYWRQALAIRDIAMRSRSKHPEDLTNLERAAMDVYNEGVQLYKERIMLEEGDRFRKISAILIGNIRNKRIKDLPQLLRDAAGTATQYFLRRKATILIDGFVFGGIPVTTTISSLSSFNSLRHKAAYHMPKVLGQKKPVFYNGNWWSIQYDEKKFYEKCKKLGKVASKDPLSYVVMGDGKKYAIPFMFSDDPKHVEAFIQALYLSQPQEERVSSHVGKVFLRNAGEIVPKWIWLRAGLPIEQFPKIDII